MAYDDGEVRQQFSLCFRRTILSGEARGSSEGREVRFVCNESLEDLDIHPSMRLRIKHAVERSREVYVG